MSGQISDYRVPCAQDLRLCVTPEKLELHSVGEPEERSLGFAVPGPLPHGDDYQPTNLPIPENGAALAAFGSALGNWLLPPPLANILRTRIQQTEVTSALRLRLVFSGGDEYDESLARLPWELAHIDETGFLALHPQIRLVREISVDESAGEREKNPIEPERPLRVLLVGANPATARYPHLAQLGPELEAVRDALEGSPECRRHVRTRTIRQVDVANLRDTLHDFRPHILHLVCHADRLPSGAAFLLCGEKGAVPVYYEELVDWMTDAPLCLIILSACGFDAAPARLARLLQARGGTADVIAMQMPLRDVAARQFARAFYSTHAESGAIEESLWQARQAVQGMGADWGVATLHRSTHRMNWEAKRESQTPRREPVPTTPNLPPAERAFIGRIGPVADVLNLFRRHQARLVTITGMGGMGKTTLARQCAHLLQADHPDGVYWVEVDTLSGREEILSALCAALDLPSGDNPLEQIRRFLSRRRVLITLDCFERNLAHRDLIASLLKISSDLHLLLTSRVVLGLEPEYEYPLAPMLLPPENPATDEEAPTPSGDPLIESVVLFADAAVRVQHGFQVDAENRVVVEDICRRLEGLPLSLVLAAGRLRYLNPRELLEQLHVRPLDVLRRRGGTDDRRDALQTVIKDSYTLLENEDRALLRQLIVFSGSFHLEDAQAVCDFSEGGDVFESMGRLRENSLVQSAVRNGRTRYYLLDTVREYLTHLGVEEGKTTQPKNRDLRHRHSIRYRDRARDLHARMKANQWRGLAADLTAEIGNLRAAIAFATEESDDAAVVEFADLLARLLIQASLWTDFDSLSEVAQRAHQRVHEPERYIRLVAYRAMIARSRGAETEARILMERWLAFCQEQGDNTGVSDALLELASQARALGDLPRAAILLTEAYEAARTAGAIGLMGRALAQQAEVALATGDHDAARRAAAAATEQLSLCRQLDILVYSRITLGRIYRVLNEPVRAEEELHAALCSSVEGAETFAVSRALLELAPLYEAVDALPRAALAYLAAERVHNNLDSRRREEATRLLRRFRRTHSGNPLVHSTLQNTRTAPWSEIVARLLTETLA